MASTSKSLFQFIYDHSYAALLLLNFLFLSPSEGTMELFQYEGKFSSFEEENIVHDLWSNIPNINKFYVDIGASDGVSWSNTARLALSGWSGLAIEADGSQVSKFLQIYKKIENVTIVEEMVTPLNICNLLDYAKIPRNFGVLSLDIDGYDYFVLEAILEKFRPTIIVTEINEKIPPPLEFTVLYQDDYRWDYSHFYGQSICQLEKLCLAKNYSIVWLEYNNAILIAKEFYQGQSLTAQEAYLQGYQLQNNRKLLFPWNENMEWLLELPPESNLDQLNLFFSQHYGKFKLEISN